MRILRVINNNVISAVDEKNREMIVVGTGIGFQGKEGKKIEERKIQKIFRLENPKTSSQFKELLVNLPIDQLEVSSKTITYAKQRLKVKLNENIYVTLTEHIHFTIERFYKNMMFPNPMLREVKLFYEEEYEVGEYALDLIEKRLKIKLPKDEAVAIALHIVSAKYNTKIKDTLVITKFIEDALQIMKEELNMQVDEDNLFYERLITHLKFLAKRILSKEKMQPVDDLVYEVVVKSCRAGCRCASKIAEDIEKKYGITLLKSEFAYLALHIEQIYQK